MFGRRAVAVQHMGRHRLSKDLTHLDGQGRARMVNVGEKAVTPRRAVATGFVRVGPELIAAIRADNLAKGNLLEVARLAGIQAAKRTAELIPLCHPLPIDGIDVNVWVDGTDVHIRAEATATWKTGVEMEALTAVSVAALTVIDMCKAVDKNMTIHSIQLLEKTGGAGGDYRREDAEAPRQG